MSKEFKEFNRKNLEEFERNFNVNPNTAGRFYADALLAEFNFDSLQNVNAGEELVIEQVDDSYAKEIAWRKIQKIEKHGNELTCSLCGFWNPDPLDPSPVAGKCSEFAMVTGNLYGCVRWKRK